MKCKLLGSYQESKRYKYLEAYRRNIATELATPDSIRINRGIYDPIINIDQYVDINVLKKSEITDDNNEPFWELTEETVSQKTLLSKITGDIISISGDAGSGKSSILVSIESRLIKDSGNIPLYLKAETFNGSQKIEDVLIKFIRRKFKIILKSEQELWNFLTNNNNYVFLIDALDEADEVISDKIEILYRDYIEKTGNRLILTHRNSVSLPAFISDRLQVGKLSENQVKELCEKYDDNAQEQPKYRKYLPIYDFLKKHNLVELIDNPLFLKLVINKYVNDVKNGLDLDIKDNILKYRTVGLLYQDIIENLIETEFLKGKLDIKDKEAEKQKIICYYQNMANHILQFGHTMDVDYALLLKEAGITKEDRLRYQSSIYVYNAETLEGHFMHRSFAEYFVALTMKQQWNMISEIKDENKIKDALNWYSKKYYPKKYKNSFGILMGLSIFDRNEFLIKRGPFLKPSSAIIEMFGSVANYSGFNEEFWSAYLEISTLKELFLFHNMGEQSIHDFLIGIIYSLGDTEKSFRIFKELYEKYGVKYNVSNSILTRVLDNSSRKAISLIEKIIKENIDNRVFVEDVLKQVRGIEKNTSVLIKEFYCSFKGKDKSVTDKLIHNIVSDPNKEGIGILVEIVKENGHAFELLLQEVSRLGREDNLEAVKLKEVEHILFSDKKEFVYQMLINDPDALKMEIYRQLYLYFQEDISMVQQILHFMTYMVQDNYHNDFYKLIYQIYNDYKNEPEIVSLLVGYLPDKVIKKLIDDKYEFTVQGFINLAFMINEKVSWYTDELLFEFYAKGILRSDFSKSTYTDFMDMQLKEFRGKAAFEIAKHEVLSVVSTDQEEDKDYVDDWFEGWLIGHLAQIIINSGKIDYHLSDPELQFIKDRLSAEIKKIQNPKSTHNPNGDLDKNDIIKSLIVIPGDKHNYWKMFTENSSDINDIKSLAEKGYAIGIQNAKESKIFKETQFTQSLRMDSIEKLLRSYIKEQLEQKKSEVAISLSENEVLDRVLEHLGISDPSQLEGMITEKEIPELVNRELED